MGVIGIGMLIGVAIPATREFFYDDRVIERSTSVILFDAMIRIPIATAFYEETLFRGVLFGMFVRRWAPIWAAVASNLLFGLWHILPTLNTLETNPAGGMVDGFIGIALAAIGSVAGTAVAGVRIPVAPASSQQHRRAGDGAYRHQLIRSHRCAIRRARSRLITLSRPRTSGRCSAPPYVCRRFLATLDGGDRQRRDLTPHPDGLGRNSLHTPLGRFTRAEALDGGFERGERCTYHATRHLDSDVVVEGLPNARFVSDRTTRPQHSIASLASIDREPDCDEGPVLVIAGRISDQRGLNDRRIGHRELCDHAGPALNGRRRRRIAGSRDR